MAASRVLADELEQRDLLLLGCGKMGGAMLSGWLAAGAPPARIKVVEPTPSAELAAKAASHGFAILDADALSGLNPDRLAALVIAVKPQMMDAALPGATALGGGGAMVLSVAAGKTIRFFEERFGSTTPIVRSMPNTPAAIGQGVTALIANDAADARRRSFAEHLAGAVGETVWLETEAQMDAVTGVSGSGPAYVFHMIEALAAAGEAEGLSPELAMRLARATVSGAGALAAAAPESAAQLRINVTSPNGTTAAGLEELMDAEQGLPPLMRRTVAAAARRSRELGG